MTKFTTEEAEEQEKVFLLDALCEGSIQLNQDFLNRFAGEKVREQLLRVPECDRSFYLSSSISKDTCFFFGSPTAICDNDIWLDMSEIEIQFEGAPEDYFEDVNDWLIDGNLAYYYVGYGLTVEVDIENLKEDIDSSI